MQNKFNQKSKDTISLLNFSQILIITLIIVFIFLACYGAGIIILNILG